MNPIVFALRRPYTVMVAVIAVALGSGLALTRMSIDIFPNLNLPVVYVCQPYGGMDPAQMEGLLTNYYEYHFLYINGIHHVESRNIQGMALMKLTFQPGTNMAQAMAEVIGYVTRSRAFMPPGTVSPFITRFDAGSVPVGYLVLSSETKSIGEIQDQALFKVRPMFAGLPGVSAPPPFGGSQRTVVVRLDPDRLRAYRMSPDEVTHALATGNVISPSGNVRIGKMMPIVPINALARQVQELETIPIRPGQEPAVYLRDVATVKDSSDIPTGSALVNGRRAVYILVTKRADFSTLSVVNNVKAALPSMQAVLPDDIKVSFEFDQSPTVTNAVKSLAAEGALGAVLTGLMVLLFLRDWRSVIVVVLNIPFAICGAIVALWLTGQTINLMTLGGLALAIGILVDESTVEVENIHHQMERTGSVARAVRRGNQQTAIPRLLAMLCVLAVFLPSFFMQGAAQALFVPLSLAVGFAMVASYLLSSTFVPVLSTWLLRHHHRLDAGGGPRRRSVFDRGRDAYGRAVEVAVRLRWLVVPVYLAVALAVIVLVGRTLGLEIFPKVDAGRFQLRLRAPDGTRYEETERLAIAALEHDHRGSRPRESGDLDRLRRVDPVELSDQCHLPVDRRARGGDPPRRDEAGGEGRHRAAQGAAPRGAGGIAAGRAAVVRAGRHRQRGDELRLAHAGGRRRYRVEPCRRPGLRRGDPQGAGRDPLVARHPVRPVARLPDDRHRGRSRARRALGSHGRGRRPLGRDGHLVEPVRRAQLLARPQDGHRLSGPGRDTLPGDGFPRADRDGADPEARVGQTALASRRGAGPPRDDAGRVRPLQYEAIGEPDGQHRRRGPRPRRRPGRAGDPAGRRPPKGATVDVRGQIRPMEEILRGLGIGLLMSIVVILLLLTANFQSVRLALVVVSTTPAVVAGVVLMLWLTRTTINLESFMGSIMAVGVAVANAILLVTFAEGLRRAGSAGAGAAAVAGAMGRLRPILMTSCAMTAGMVPMALGLTEGGEQTAPLGRAVIGGLVAATIATLTVLPTVFALVQGRAGHESASLDPDDPESPHYHEEDADALVQEPAHPSANGESRALQPRSPSGEAEVPEHMDDEPRG